MGKFEKKPFTFSGNMEEAKSATSLYAKHMANGLEVFEYVFEIISKAGVVLNPGLKDMVENLLGDYRTAMQILAFRAAIDEGKDVFDKEVSIDVDKDGKITIKYSREG